MNIALIIIGLILACGGTYISQTARPPYDTLAAFSCPLGVACAVIGALLTAVPRFFM